MKETAILKSSFVQTQKNRQSQRKKKSRYDENRRILKPKEGGFVILFQ